ncbi:MAG: helix-turn-helix domain-containing protein [Thermoplasmata archaeon]|nr:MAG: helix-turn-helix domain-containing protein [Thermoplasmata archaeon]
MHFIDTRILVQHLCPFCDFSKVFPEAEISLWCNRSNEVLQITASDPSHLMEIVQAAHEYLGAHEIFSDDQSALTMIKDCTCSETGSVAAIADEYGCWIVPPVTYRGGWETHRVISSDNDSMRKLITEIKKTGKVKILSKRSRVQLDVIRDIGVVPVHFFEGLTDRQIHALVVAYENGLFDIPARNKMDHVALKEEISRSTFGEHLRKAQLQLMKNSYPLLKLKDVRKSSKRKPHA